MRRKPQTKIAMTNHAPCAIEQAAFIPGAGNQSGRAVLRFAGCGKDPYFILLNGDRRPQTIVMIERSDVGMDYLIR